MHRPLTFPVAALIFALETCGAGWTANAAGPLPSGSGAAAPASGSPRSIDLSQSLDELLAVKVRVSDGERLRRLFDEVWRSALEDAPELATWLGYQGYDDRWSDLSPAAIARRKALLPKVLAAAESIDRSALGEAQRNDLDLFRRRARLDVEGCRFPEELLAITQLGGIQQDVPEVLASMPTGTVAQCEDVLARLRGVPRLVEQTIALLAKGLAAGVTPPRVTLRAVPEQIAALLVEDPLKSPLLTAFAKLPSAIPPAEQERLRRQAMEILSRQVVPAFRKLRDYVETAYLPRARESIAMSELPDGGAWYAFKVRRTTTTDLSPRQIHAIGLAEVRRIRKEMDDQIARIGFAGSFDEFQHFLRSDPRFFFERPEDLLVAYRDICKRIDPQLAKLFGRLPQVPYGVLPVPAYAEKSALIGYYDLGSLAAGRPGYFYVNTYDLKSRPKWGMEALALHEAVPGHHLQLSLAQEREGLPEWRRYDVYTAFVEGWALYAESLGAEIGMYQDPYSKFGQLINEMMRAIRLVVDTGMHAMGWTRQQAFDFCRENAAKPESEITIEIDRYIANPGQALAYKIGELKFKELRAYAARELGESFDLRAFHDQVLSRGAVPLDVLQADLEDWVARRRAAAAAAKAAGAGSRP